MAFSCSNIKKFQGTNPGAFLYFGKGTFRTVAYLELEAYSEHCQTSTMERFAKIDT